MRFFSDDAGLTVLEVVVGVGLSFLLMTALLRFLVAGYPLSRITWLQANSNETARIQLKRIRGELRKVQAAENGAYALAEMLPQRVVFFADVDFDGETERVRYELAGTDLERGIIQPSGEPAQYNVLDEEVNIVARSIRNGADDIFVYYGGDYPDDQTPLTPVDVTEVKYIQFHLLIDADEAVAPDAVSVRSQVQLRNLKDNLGEEAN